MCFGMCKKYLIITILIFFSFGCSTQKHNYDYVGNMSEEKIQAANKLYDAYYANERADKIGELVRGSYYILLRQIVNNMSSKKEIYSVDPSIPSDFVFSLIDKYFIQKKSFKERILEFYLGTFSIDDLNNMLDLANSERGDNMSEIGLNTTKLVFGYMGNNIDKISSSNDVDISKKFEELYNAFDAELIKHLNPKQSMDYLSFKSSKYGELYLNLNLFFIMDLMDRSFDELNSVDYEEEFKIFFENRNK